MTTTSAGRTEAAETAARFRIAITRLSRVLRASSPGGLTQSQWSALGTVEQHQPVRLGDIADAEGVSAPTATRVIASLEALGLISRITDPADRRSSQVSLTPTGAEKIDWARKLRTEALSDRLSALPPVEIERLIDCLPLLEKLAADS